MYARKMADTDKEAARKSTRKPIHYAYICLLCSVYLAESKERRAVKGKGTFDIYGAIKSMPWEINVCEKSYVCRKCEARLKKKVNLEEALSKLLEELRGLFFFGGGSNLEFGNPQSSSTPVKSAGQFNIHTVTSRTAQESVEMPECLSETKDSQPDSRQSQTNVKVCVSESFS